MPANSGGRLKKAILLAAIAALGIWLAWLLMRLVPALTAA